MPLPLPELDTRRWDELVAEGRAMVPTWRRAGPSTTSPTPASPWSSCTPRCPEILLYRIDRITPAHLRSLPALAGDRAAPGHDRRDAPGAAAEPGLPAVARASGFKVRDPVSTAVFEAGRHLTVSPAWLELDDAEATERGRIMTGAGGVWTDSSACNGRPGPGFLALGPTPAVGDALYLGFDTRRRSRGRS